MKNIASQALNCNKKINLVEVYFALLMAYIFVLNYITTTPFFQKSGIVFNLRSRIIIYTKYIYIRLEIKALKKYEVFMKCVLNTYIALFHRHFSPIVKPTTDHIAKSISQPTGKDAMTPRQQICQSLKNNHPRHAVKLANKPNRFVEFWNTLPGVRHHRIGTKTYAQVVGQINRLASGTLFRFGSVDELWKTKNNIPAHLLVRKWSNEELENGLRKLSRVAANWGVRNPGKPQWGLCDLLLSSFGTSQFLYAQVHGPNIERIPQLPTPDAYMTEIIDKAMVMFDVKDDKRWRCHWTLERLWDHYECEVQKPLGLSASDPWGTFYLFMTQPEGGMLKWLNDTYGNGSDMHLGWIKPTAKPVERFIAYVKNKLRLERQAI